MENSLKEQIYETQKEFKELKELITDPKIISILKSLREPQVIEAIKKAI